MTKRTHAPACFFVCSACAYPNYGGSGGAAFGLAGFFVTGIPTPAWATTI
ncbi:TPA: hypothetical protein ACJH2U_005100 [Salmonella enterica subsp. enterica serovar Saintpaul]